MAETDPTLEEAERERPPAYMRVAVLIGVATLLLGISGLFWLESGPPTPSFVRVRGVAQELQRMPDLIFELEASWEDDEGELWGEAGHQGREPDVWFFNDVPEGREVRIQVYRRNEADRVAYTEGTLRLKRGRIHDLP